MIGWSPPLGEFVVADLREEWPRFVVACLVVLLLRRIVLGPDQGREDE